MNNQIKLFCLFLCVAATACKKSSDESAPINPGPATVNEILSELAPSPERFTKNIQWGAHFETASGVSIDVPWQGVVDAAGQKPTGEVVFEVRTMLTIKDMILNNCPTVGPDGLFVSGGQFSISAKTIGGTPLQIKPSDGMIRVKIPYKIALGQPVINFPIWTASGTNSSFAWSPADSVATDTTNTNITNTPTWLNDTVGSVVTTYPSISIPNFGLFNLDYYYHQPGPQTNMYVRLPQGLSDTNSVCYLAFPQISCVAKLLTFNYATNSFGMNNYTVPVGLTGKAIVISKNNSQYKYHIIPFTVSTNLVLNATPVNATLEQLRAALDNL